MLPFNHFTSEQISPLILSAIILIISVISFKKHLKFSLLFLFIGTIGLGYFIANLDPFLILWDEQYHALVAKNMAENFLRPTLYNHPILDFDYTNWSENNIWLHKQPLFLWQIALSIKVLGTTAFAVRLPSVLMHAIIPLFIYRIGKILINKETGYYGALLFAVAYFPLELVAGRYSTDHNDVAFLFYVTASFWSWLEYSQSKKRYWFILIGLFSGGAVLVKWLMGLLVYVIWTITTAISNYPKNIKIQSYFPILLSSIISLLVFLPWQVYIHLKYPIEAAHEMDLNSRHFFEVIEGHRESTWYYFTDGLETIYGAGNLIPFILLVSTSLFLVAIKNKKHQIFITSVIIFVYLFYTLASTKMVSFPIIVSPIFFLSMGYLIFKILSVIEPIIKSSFLNQSISTSLLVLIAFTTLNLSKIETNHTDLNPYNNHNRVNEQMEMNFIQSLDKELKKEDYVIFNASITLNGQIPIMFFTNYIAYKFIPTQSQIEEVRKEGKKVAIIDLGNIPNYILLDKQIKVLNVK